MYSESEYFYTVKTDRGIRYYECANIEILKTMVLDDGLAILNIVTVDVESRNIPNFIVYGERV